MFVQQNLHPGSDESARRHDRDSIRCSTHNCVIGTYVFVCSPIDENRFGQFPLRSIAFVGYVNSSKRGLRTAPELFIALGVSMIIVSAT